MDGISKRLADLARGNEEYAEFSRRIVNTKQQVLGVRMPDLRKLAKSVTGKIATANEVRNFMRLADKKVYEEVLLCGLVIGYAKLTDLEKIYLTRQYLRHVDSWGQIDTVVVKLKIESKTPHLHEGHLHEGSTLMQNRELWWDFANECLGLPAEFTVRYGVIVMMANFIKGDKLYKVLRTLQTVRHEGYYVKMAIAWLYATTAAVGDYKLTLHEATKLEPWTRRKALTKMLESYRFTPAQKAEIRALRATITL
ncbi:MAG: DNA alkylation repair protein [Candidatus Nomurabacteria bacterium]|jgi:3-methyladenine DNA glycosylase AlkD|nr:DNA alkylation repair protein [Candidatus Nomurabacteria bacterium]